MHCIYIGLQVFPLRQSSHPTSLREMHHQTTRSQIFLTSWEVQLPLCTTWKCPLSVSLLWHDFYHSPSMQCRAAEQGSFCLSRLTRMACGLRNRAGVSQGWTLSLGDRRSRLCYLFKFQLFLCVFSGLSVGWKVFPLSHCTVPFCQTEPHRA